jgi:hypothetical protein
VHRSRLLILAGVLVAGLGLFLPQVRLPTIGPVDGFDGAAWPVMLPLGALAVLALLGDRPEGLRRPVGVAAALLACAALGFAAAKVIDAASAAGVAQGGAVRSGPWVVLTGTILTVVGTVLSFSRRIG